MRMYDLIMKKRNGGAHTKEEIDFIVSGFTGGGIPDYQMSAWLMCVYYQGMTKEETVYLTTAMADSGERLDLSAIDGVKVDKHSTGGVGDKTTFIVAPILAACGVPIAKMSGRGLGHTGGTIDKLESIPGFHVSLSTEDFIANVNRIRLALVGQTGDLAPADKKIYALRDVTAAVDSLPLIASSIMSKKLAAGADVIVLDIKCGSGAFMKEEKDAVALAKTMVEIGNAAGKRTYGLITDMNEPLGCKVGNALEVCEAIEVLGIKDVNAYLADEKNKGISRLLSVSLALASYMLLGAGKASDAGEARAKCIRVIENGRALDKFAEFVGAQGGDVSYIYDTSKFEKAAYTVPVTAPRAGYITACNTSEVGMVSLILGGGRKTKDSVIDLSVGIDVRRHIGDSVACGDVIAYLHANSEDVVEEAKSRLLAAYTIEGHEANIPLIVKQIITE